MSEVSSPAVTPAITFDDDTIAAAIKKIRVAGRTFARAVETVLVMAVYDSIVNESADVANEVVGALRTSTKKDAIVAFLQEFGQLADVGGKVGFEHFALGKQAHLTWSREYVEAVQEAAADWESFRVKKPVVARDMLESLTKLIDSASKKDAKFLNADLLPHLVATKAKYVSDAALKAAQESAAAVGSETPAEVPAEPVEA